jgi:hypothetical protein
MTYRKLCLILLVLILIPACQILAQFEPPDAIVSLTDTRLRAHPIPVLDSETTFFLDPAQAVKVIGRTTDQYWLQVRADVNEGWVVSEFLTVLADVTPVPVTAELSTLDRGYSLPPDVVEQVRDIFRHGQELGNRANVFSKVGDSISESPHYLRPFATRPYNLGDFQYLQGVIDYYSTEAVREGSNSFANISIAAGTGWSSDAVISPEFADPYQCLTGETPLACEYRVVRPSVALIMFGTNDTGHFEPVTYEFKLQQIIEFSIAQGVIPVLSTIPIRLGYEAKVTAFNEVVAKNTARYHIPLWDYGSAMATLPGFGLDTDGVHPSIPAGGLKGAVDFRAVNLYSGYVIRNLTALQALDLVWKATR